MGFDEAIKYIPGVANRHMAQGLKTALNSNPYYDSVDVGEIIENITKMGPVDLIKFLKKKHAFRDEAVATFLDAKTSDSSWVPAFGSDIDEDDVSSSNAVALLESLLGVENPTPTPAPTPTPTSTPTPNSTPTPTSTNVVISESENSSDDTLSPDSLPAETKKRSLDTKSTGLSRMKKSKKQ